MKRQWTGAECLRCCGSKRFAGEMIAASPFTDLDHAISSARFIWFNKIDVNGWLESFAAHPEIGSTSKSISQWSREEQTAAQATSTDSTLQELLEWNARYKEKFGFVFLICASGRSTPEIIAELKKRYTNRPIVELQLAAEEEMKIIELRLAKLFEDETRANIAKPTEVASGYQNNPGDRIGIIGAHLAADSKPSVDTQRTRPPITTHILDVSRGSPASGVEVHLEKWKGALRFPSLRERDSSGEWVFHGSSVTNSDGRAGPLMGITDHITPGFYRINFDTGSYQPSGFFPYVSIVFQVKESQTAEHFHVPLLLSPFSFTTYRGS